MLHPHIEVRTGPHGLGLFAARPIRPGEVTWQADPDWDRKNNRFSESEIAQWPEERQRTFYFHSYQVSETDWVGGNQDDDPSLYMNHSCDPNTWFVSDLRMVARRDIAAGEEITYDYATSQAEDTLFDCACGSSLCRKRVTGQEYREPWFQERYAGHTLSYLAERMERLRPPAPVSPGR
jgi:SET domain-containing protein